MAICAPMFIEHDSFESSLAQQQKTEIATNPSYCTSVLSLLKQSSTQK